MVKQTQERRMCLPPGGRKERAMRAKKERTKLAHAIVHKFYAEYSEGANAADALERTSCWVAAQRRMIGPAEASLWDQAKGYAYNAINKTLQCNTIPRQKALMSALNQLMSD